MSNQQELIIRRAAARHLSGIPARQNAASIDMLETQIVYDEMVARFGSDEIERCNSLEEA